MSLTVKERFAASWPRIVVRLVIIAIVFIGLIVWEQNKPKSVEQTTATTAPAGTGGAFEPAIVPIEQRPGVAVMFVLDFQQPATLSDQAKVNADGAAPLVNAMKLELDRLTRYAGSHSQLLLRAGVMVTGFAPREAEIPGSEAGTDPLIVLPLAAPVPGAGLSHTLTDTRPGKTAALDDALKQANTALTRSGLSKTHVVVVTTQQAVANQIRQQSEQDNAKANGAKVHVVVIGNQAKPDQSLDALVDGLLLDE